MRRKWRWSRSPCSCCSSCSSHHRVLARRFPFVFTVRLVRLVSAPPSRRTRRCGYILRLALQPPSPKHAPHTLAGWLLRVNARQTAQLEHTDIAADAAGCVSVRVSRRESGAAFKRGWVFFFFPFSIPQRATPTFSLSHYIEKQ